MTVEVTVSEPQENRCEVIDQVSPYPHLNAESVTSTVTSQDSIGTIGRTAAFLVGAVTVCIQVTYTWATLPVGDWSLRVAPVLCAVGLAGALVLAERHWHMRQVAKSFMWCVTFLLLLSWNFSTTLTRVTEVRAIKAANEQHAGDLQHNATEALQKALVAEDESRTQMQSFCAMKQTVVIKETSGTGKKAVNTNRSASEIDPRCEPAKDALKFAMDRTEAARRAVASSVVSASTNGISPAAKSIAALTSFNAVTVDHAMDFVQPLGLDALALVAFLTAFSAKPKHRMPRKEKSSVPKTAPPSNVVKLVVKGLKQQDVNTLVAAWLKANGIPEGKSMGECLKLFCDWAHLPKDEAVTPVTFGRAFDALNIARRTLNGRKVVSKQAR